MVSPPAALPPLPKMPGRLLDPAGLRPDRELRGPAGADLHSVSAESALTRDTVPQVLATRCCRSQQAILRSRVRDLVTSTTGYSLSALTLDAARLAGGSGLLPRAASARSRRRGERADSTQSSFQ